MDSNYDFSVPKITYIDLLSEEINKLLDSNQDAIENSDLDLVSVKTFNTRENLIVILTDLVNKISGISTKLTVALDKTRVAHNQEIVVVDTLMNKVHKKLPDNKIVKNVSADTPWTKVVRGKSKNKKCDETESTESTHMIALVPSLAERVEVDSKYIKIKFTEALHLLAVRILSFDQVSAEGELYYVEPADHFAIKIAGHLFHGNIGTIYTEERNPSKIKDCKFADSCVKQDKCDYYHDPIKFTGSKDHRNYIASSFLYAPPGINYKGRPRGRQYGSRDYLDVDIVEMGDEDRQRFHDQTMHDILCSLLLMKSIE